MVIEKVGCFKGSLTQSLFFMAVPGDLYYMGPLNCRPIEDINTLWNYSFLLAAAMHYILQAWQLQPN